MKFSVFNCLALLTGVIAFAIQCGPNLSAYQHLTTPRITTLADQPMLEVQAVGAPGETVGPAFKELFGAFYRLRRTHKQLQCNAPRARWPKPLETPVDQWLGIYGIPITAEIHELPVSKSETRVTIAVWQYGTVAEILHIGSYDSEDETVRRLKAFIDQQGYRISGPHEEEYLRGPGMFGKGNPKKYQTIIRYPVEMK